MLTRIFAILALLIALITIGLGYTQSSALVLRQQQQSQYWPRYHTEQAGLYRNGQWVPIPIRADYGTNSYNPTSSGFRGGGPGSGK